MLRTVTLNGQTYSYEFQRKRVKNINLRIRPDGSIAVSANRLVPLAAVERFLQEKADFIARAVARQEAAMPAPATPLVTGTEILLFGVRMPLSVRPGLPGVCREGEALILTLPDPADETVKKQLMDGYILDTFRREMERICRQIYPEFAALGVAFPAIRYRNMKSRWGSCNPSKGVVTFNTRLAMTPPCCMEYVAVHEFCHFLHPDHSPAFHTAVSALLPDWKERKAILNRPDYFYAGAQLGKVPAKD